MFQRDFFFPEVALLRTFNVQLPSNFESMHTLFSNIRVGEALKKRLLNIFGEHTCMYIYRYLYICNVVTSPKVQQRMKARAESKFCEKLSFHRFYVSHRFTAFTAWGFATFILALYWMGLPHKHSPASWVSILLNSPQRINHSQSD